LERKLPNQREERVVKIGSAQLSYVNEALAIGNEGLFYLKWLYFKKGLREETLVV